MTADPTHAAAQARIEEWRAVIAAGTPGPWEVSRFFWLMPDEWWTSVEVDGGVIACMPEEAEPSLPNADLTAAAVNAFGPLLDLAAGVLERHKPSGPFCHAHGPRGKNPVLWPCPDARAALTALGLTPEETK